MAELKRLTGISLQVDDTDSENFENTLEQIHKISSAYREKYNKRDFLRGLMVNGLPSYDVQERAERLHINSEKQRVLFLLEAREITESMTEVLKNLFPSQTKVYLVPMTEHSLVLLYPVKKTEEEFSPMRTAQTLVDILNSEAMVRVQISYSAVFGALTHLPEAYQEAALALSVGKIFYSGHTVFPYDSLGVGRLIYQLPRPLCESFLHEVFGDNVPEQLDEETSSTVRRFLENNLNIAETSRQLHMHRNTLIYRLEQIQKRTGLDLRSFDDAMTFKTAMMVMNYLHAERKH